VVPKDTTGLELKQMMLERFNTKMSSEGIEVDIRKNNFDTDTILTIASIIQREAGSKSDMYLVSGIIWNRIFTNMSLQMDATLQYAKGTAENGWWPKVVPDDKYIESPYNTYKNKGLPPSPIANPGFAAIHAALHPKETECIFYFHKNRKNYCSKTYEEHKRKIDLYLK
jgi:UPF0755 protein